MWTEYISITAYIVGGQLSKSVPRLSDVHVQEHVRLWGVSKTQTSDLENSDLETSDPLKNN